MQEGKSLFEKKNPNLDTWLNLIQIIFPEKEKYLSGWRQLAEEKIIRLCLCHTIFINF